MTTKPCAQPVVVHVKSRLFNIKIGEIKGMYYFLLVMLFTSLSTKAQQKTDETTPCREYAMQMQGQVSLEKAYIFNQLGIDLNKYDWSNSDVNCHINSSLLYNQKSINLKYLAYATAGVGVSCLLSGIIMKSSKLPDSGWGQPAPDPGGGGLIGFGVIGIGGSVPLYIFSKKYKDKSNIHFGEVSKYYRIQKWK